MPIPVSRCVGEGGGGEGGIPSTQCLYLSAGLGGGGVEGKAGPHPAYLTVMPHFKALSHLGVPPPLMYPPPHDDSAWTG